MEIVRHGDISQGCIASKIVTKKKKDLLIPRQIATVRCHTSGLN
jgi:hypothetical protein